MSTPTNTAAYQVCKPKTSDHRRGMKWFASLTRLMEERIETAEALALEPTADDRVSLQHSVQLYSVFAETGDARYLELCEDFLRYTLKPARAHE